MEDWNQGVPESVPLACVRGAIPEHLRTEHFQRIARLFGEELEREDLPGGFAFRFSADSFEEVARFVDNERRCCPFLHFAIELPPNGDAMWLSLTGPRGTRAFLESELPGLQE